MNPNWLYIILALVTGLLIYFRKSINWIKILVVLSQYAIWFVLNFVFGLLPVIIVLFLAEWQPEESSINSLLSFSFTLLVSSVYIFSVYRKNFDIDNALILINIVFAVVVLLVFYSIATKVPLWFYDWVTLNGWKSIYLLTTATLVISFFLNFRSIRAQVDNILNKRKLSSVNEGYDSLYEKGSK